jgi:hypothetical protein
MKVFAGAFTLLVSLTVAMDQAVAGFFKIIPNPPPPPPPPVAAPEIDAAGGIAAIALLASIAAILFNKFRTR